MKTNNTTPLPKETIDSITTELKVKNYITKGINNNTTTFVTYKITKKGIDYTKAYFFIYLGDMTTERTITLPNYKLDANTALLIHYKGKLNVVLNNKFDALKTSKKTIIEDNAITYNSSEFKKTLEVWLKATGKGKGFQETEYLGRSLFVQMKPDLDIYFTEDKYAPYDAEFTNSRGELTLVEIKTRDIDHNDYKDALFEIGKLYKMQSNKHNRNAHQMLYINFYKDKKAVCWILEKYENVTPITLKSKYQTHGNSMKVDKLFIPLPIKEGYSENLNFESTHFNKIKIIEQTPYNGVTINFPKQTELFTNSNII